MLSAFFDPNSQQLQNQFFGASNQVLADRVRHVQEMLNQNEEALSIYRSFSEALYAAEGPFAQMMRHSETPNGLIALESAWIFGGILGKVAYEALLKTSLLDNEFGDGARAILMRGHGRIGVYGGSFDPFTLGHRDVCARAAQYFDEVIVAIGINPAKSALLSTEEKVFLIEHELSQVPGKFRVVPFSGLLAHFAISQGASTLIRGVRGITDTAVEEQLAAINREQSRFSDLDTIFIPSRTQLQHVSSSAVKELLKNGGNVATYVSRFVEEALTSKIAGKEIFEQVDNFGTDKMDHARATEIVISRWTQLAKRLRINDEAIRFYGEKIISAYSEPSRAHHDIVHIAEGLLLMERAANEIAALEAFELAWLFHDYVYDVSDLSKGGNEIKSLEVMQQYANALGIGKGVINRASQLINATIDHGVFQGDSDGELFIDTDLWILAAPEERYARYVSDIRKEYSIYEDSQYIPGRLKFLASMDKRPEIFKSEYFRALYEFKAQQNLDQEFSNLVWGQVIAVTGQIGSGKSTLTNEFEKVGFKVLSADQIARALREPDSSVYRQILGVFGDEILGQDSRIDTSKLAKIVFRDNYKLVQLEAILHPEIERAARSQFFEEISNGQQNLVFELPLLFEAQMQDRGYREIISVIADPEVRIERVMQRDNCTREQAIDRMKRQVKQTEQIQGSSIVIENNGSQAEFAQKVGQVVSNLKR